MGNPITDLWNLAVGEWRNITGGYIREWHIVYNSYYQGEFQAAVADSFTDLSKAFEYATILSAVSDADNVQIGRDTARGTIENFKRLAWPILPKWGGLAAQWADRVAFLRARQVYLDAVKMVALEHARMELRVLQEELGRDVAIAKEHADMVTRVAIERNDRTIMVNTAVRNLTALITKTRQEILAQLAAEVKRLTGLIDQVRAYAQSIPGLIDQRAVNGYDPTLRARHAGLQRLLDTVAAHNPLIAGLVGDIVTALVDLAEIDNPVIRIAAQFILRQIIDRLGLDTALRKLVDGILGDILGHGPPKTLLDVEASVGQRLNAAEAGLVALSPLAGEADDLHELGTLAFDAALTGYVAAGITSPRAWADDTNAVLRVTIDPLLNPLLRLLGAP